MQAAPYKTRQRNELLCNVVTVPVKNAKDQVIGTLQRNIEMSSLHKFLADNFTDIFFVDNSGKVAAHSMYELAKK